MRFRTEQSKGRRSDRRWQAMNSSPPNSQRRLISLCVLLALVLVLMQRASNPTYVRNAFTALGVPLDTNLSNATAAADRVVQPDRSLPPTLATNAFEKTCQDLVPKLLDRVSSEQVRQLAALWFANQAVTAEAASSWQQLISDCQTALAEITLQADSAQEKWQLAVRDFQQDWNKLVQRIGMPANSGPPLRPQASVAFVHAMDHFLDDRLLGELRDAAPWDSREAIAFWRLLQRCTSPPPATEVPAPLINTLQLESQRDVYRSKRVRFQGYVHRAEWFDRARPEFGISAGYGLLWLEGADENAQPVAVYTPDSLVQQIVMKADPTAGRASLPQVEVTAIVAKRLAYGAMTGVEVAPTLFATNLQWLNPSTTVAAEASAGQPPWMWIVGLALGLAVCLAVCLAVPMFWQQVGSKSARRAKSQRPMCLLLLAGLGIASVTTPQQIAWGQATAQSLGRESERAPWEGQPADDQLRRLLDERLNGILSNQAFQELAAYTGSAERGDFPNAGLKLLNLVNQLGWSRVLGTAASMPLAAGCKTVNQNGIVRLAQPILLSESQQAWFPSSTIYRLEVEPYIDGESPSSKLTTVYCMSIPNSWMSAAQLCQPIQLRGLGLFDASATALPSPLCLLVQQPTWTIPDKFPLPELAPLLKPEWMRLGRAGWNLSWIELLQKNNQAKITNDEQEAFYSFLRIASRETENTSGEAAMELAGEPSSIRNAIDVLQDSRERIASPVNWTVRLVQVARVEVTDSSSREWLGSDHYFQFDGLVDIGRQSIRYKVPNVGDGRSDPGDSTAVEFRGEFPVTIVSLNSDPLTAAQLNSGQTAWKLGHYAQLDGTLYRLWSYHSEYLEKQQGDRREPQGIAGTSRSGTRQVAPLIVANSIQLSPPPPRRLSGNVGWFGAAMVMAVVAILGLMWIYAVPRAQRRR